MKLLTEIQVSRSSQHYATVKLDPPVEPVQKRTEDETEPPVTPIPSRTRPQETDTAPGLSSWASPAFFQRSRASFGNLVDSRIDPFVEEDGFVPGKGRKRPKFSVRGSEWRVLDEPASPGEKASPVDWTEELEDESVEAEVDGEGTTKDIGVSQEAPGAAEPSPTEQETPGDMAPESTTVEDTAVSTNQAVPEINLGEEQPVESEVTEATEAVRQVNENGDSANTRHLPIDTPHLHPIPSPGLPVPSPLVSATSDQHGYFTSITTATQTRTPQHSTTAMQSQTTDIEINAVSELQSETSQVEGPAPERVVEDPSASVAEAATREAISPQTPEPAITTGTAEPGVVETIQTEEQEGRVAARDDENIRAPSHDREVSVEEEVQVQDMHLSPKDIDMEEDEGEDVDAVSSDEQEDEENDEEDDEEVLQQGGELDEENEPEEISSEEEEGEQEREREREVEDEEDEEHGERDRPGQIIDIHRDQGPDKDATHKYPEEAAADESDSAQSQEDEEEQDFYNEEDDGEPRGEEMYDEEKPEDEYESKYAYEDSDQDVVDSELESEEDRNEQPHQAQTSLKSAQPEIIVLDSDDENEPGETSQENPPAESKREPSEASVDGHESPDKTPAEEEADDWLSDEEEQVQDEIVADEELEKEDHEGEDPEDDYDQDEDDQAEDDEEVEVNEEPEDKERAEDKEPVEERVEPVEDEAVEEDLASDVQEQGSLEDEQERYEQMDDQEEEEEEEQGDEEQVDEQEHADITTPAEHETMARVYIDEEPAEGYYEETHATEDLPQPRHQDLHESAAPVEHLSPPAPAIDPALSLESGAKDVVPNGKQDRIEETSEVRIEEPPPAEPEQRVNAGLYYDGAASPRVMHESTNKGHKVSDSESRAVTPDEFREHDPSHQAISFNHTAIQQTQEPPNQAKAATNGDETFVDAQEEEGILSTTENEPRSRSLSILGQERSSVNENTAHEDLQLQIQATVDEAESIESEDEDHMRNRIFEEPETYFQHPTAPDRHYPGLRSKLSYFAPLATLVDHFNTLVDTISVVSDTSPMTQSTSGKKDYAITLYLTDPSMAGTILTAHLCRPYIEALPVLEEGDAILLRNFHVESSDHSMTLVSIDTSAWAVFSGQGNEEVQINGPPVEYGAEESSHAAHLRQWYREDGAVMVADNQLQASIERASRDVTPLSSSVAASDSASLDDSFGRDGGRRELSRSLRRGRKSHRRITIHELRDGRRYAEVGSPSDRESIHELRDGTVYANL